jgi:hypothetical protein
MDGRFLEKERKRKGNFLTLLELDSSKKKQWRKSKTKEEWSKRNTQTMYTQNYHVGPAHRKALPWG